MKKQSILFVGAILFILFFLVACKPLQKEVILTTGDSILDVPSKDNGVACGDSFCGENQECKNNICYCQTGFRTCINKCIPDEGCCFDKECNSRSCENNICSNEKKPAITVTPPKDIEPEQPSTCDLLSCKSNMICTSDDTCGCAENYFWCEYQDKCIKFGNCCTGVDCSGSDDCQFSGESLQICMEEYEDEICKRVKDDKTNIFSIGSDTFSVKINKIINNGETAHLEVNGKKLQAFNKYTKYKLSSGPIIFFESAYFYGGKCE